MNKEILLNNLKKWAEAREKKNKFNKEFNRESKNLDSTVLYEAIRWLNKEQPKERCICAAVKTKEGEIIRCHRHHDGIAAIKWRDKELMESDDGQGFITSKNRFVTRQEGFRLQKEAEILSVDPEGFHGQILFSEDLY